MWCVLGDQTSRRRACFDYLKREESAGRRSCADAVAAPCALCVIFLSLFLSFIFLSFLTFLAFLSFLFVVAGALIFYGPAHALMNRSNDFFSHLIKVSNKH